MPGCISTSTAFLFMDFSGNGKIYTAEYVWYGQCLSDVFIVDSHQKKKKKSLTIIESLKHLNGDLKHIFVKLLGLQTQKK